MKPFNIFKLSLLIASPLALLGCAGDQYARQSSTDDLYFSRSDRQVTQGYQEDLSAPSPGYSEDYLRNRETDLDYGDEEYTARDVNPEYIAKYKKQGEDNLNREGEAEEDVYFEEDYNQDVTYSNYTGGNAYSQPNFRNNGAWQNNPYTFGPNRWNRPWNNGFNSGWSFGMYSGWSNWGNSFGWNVGYNNVGYNYGNPWGWNDPWMNPYSAWGWNDPWMNPYNSWGNPYYSRMGYGWGYPTFYRPYYPVRQVVVVRPAEPGVAGNVQVVNGYRGSRSNTIGVRNPDSRTNRRIMQEPASADNPNEDRIVTPDRYRYSRERTEESPRSRSRSEMNRSNNNNRSNRSVSPSRNSNRSNNTYQRSRSRSESGSGSGGGTYQRSNSNNRSSGSGGGTYQRSRRSNNSSGGGGGSTFSSPSRNSSSGGSTYSPSRSRSSSGNSSSGGGSRSRSRRGGGGEQ